MKTLRLLLGDQLNLQHSWFDEVNPNVIYLMAEMRQETDYVKHHVQKVGSLTRWTQPKNLDQTHLLHSSSS